MATRDRGSSDSKLARRLRRGLLRLPVIAVLAALVGGGTAIGLTTAQAAPTGSGVVVINTGSAYGAGAGTGMVLTSSGEILTNNHVIDGATTIRVVIPETGKGYTAKVVGYDATHDVAVLRAQGASNLRTVTVGNSSTVRKGQTVTAIGNAGGTGSLSTTTGEVTALSRSITVSDEDGGSSRLTALLETDAELQPGDSGGPLFDSAHEVIGMDTAASVSGWGYGSRQVSSGDGYAIPINRAISIVRQIEAGKASSTVHIGATAYLGVMVGDGYGTGVTIGQIVSDGPASAAGLGEGDVITAFAGRAVTSASQLGTLVKRQKAGARVAVTYRDGATGTTRTATVTLGSGPAA